MQVKIGIFFILSFCGFAVYGVQETDSLQLICQKQVIKSVNFEDLQWMFRERVQMENQFEIPIQLDFSFRGPRGFNQKLFLWRCFRR